MSHKESSGFFLLVIFLPVLIALGHDVFLFFSASDDFTLDVNTISRLYHENRPGRGFSFASLGFIWTQYSPETFRIAVDSFEPEEWRAVRHFLSFKAVHVAAVFSFGLYALISVFRFFTGIRRRKARRF